MNRDHRMVEVIGVTAGGKWAEWNLPCPQPPVPGTQPDAPSAPVDLRATAVRTGALLVAMHSQDWQLVPKVWDEAGSDENRLEMMKLAVSLVIEELLARQRDPLVFAQELAAPPRPSLDDPFFAVRSPTPRCHGTPENPFKGRSVTTAPGLASSPVFPYPLIGAED